MKFLITLIVAAILLIEARTALAGGLTINSSSETIFLMDSGDGAAALLETPPPHFGPTLISENPCLEFIGCADLEDLEDLQFRDSSALALLNLDASSDAVWRPVRAEAALGVTPDGGKALALLGSFLLCLQAIRWRGQTRMKAQFKTR